MKTKRDLMDILGAQFRRRIRCLDVSDMVLAHLQGRLVQIYASEVSYVLPSLRRVWPCAKCLFGSRQTRGGQTGIQTSLLGSVVPGLPLVPSSTTTLLRCSPHRLTIFFIDQHISGQSCQWVLAATVDHLRCTPLQWLR